MPITLKTLYKLVDEAYNSREETTLLNLVIVYRNNKALLKIKLVVENYLEL